MYIFNIMRDIIFFDKFAQTKQDNIKISFIDFSKMELNINEIKKIIDDEYLVIDIIFYEILSKMNLIKHMYNIMFLYSCYNHEQINISNKEYITNFIKTHIHTDNNSITYKLYKGDILNVRTKYKYIYKIGTSNVENVYNIKCKCENISLLTYYINKNINPINGDDLYISFICNKTCSVKFDDILFEI